MTVTTDTKSLPGGPQLPKIDDGRANDGRHKGKTKASLLIELWRSDIGKKWLMAISGIVLMCFIFGHMVGNLKLYLGPEQIDHYAEFLRQLLVPLLPPTAALWLIRIVLIAAFVIHISAAALLTKTNHNARDVRYQGGRHYLAADFASRTMRWTGIIVGLFLIYHLLDLTWGVTNPDFVAGSVYDNVVASFSRVPIAIVYVIANLALGFHLYHGSWSLFQSIGWNSPRFNPQRRWFAIAFALAIALPNISFPIAVQAGVIG